MRAVVAARFAPDAPLSALEVRDDHPEPEPADGWEVVELRAAAVNHHDLWSLRGVGLRDDELPRVLGSDAAAATADGREVLLYPVVAAAAGVGLLSEGVDGTHAERIAIPSQNLVERPAWLTPEEAACTTTAWLTAWGMLDATGCETGDRVLVQGATGGVASAAILLGSHRGLQMVATSRSQAKRAQARAWGAVETREPGERLSDRVSAVLETVGEATFEHSHKSLRGGGTIVVSGATTGHLPRVDLRRLFAKGQRIQGHSMGTPDQLRALLAALGEWDLRPEIDSVHPLADAADAYARLAEGDVVGKVVLTP